MLGDLVFFNEPPHPVPAPALVPVLVPLLGEGGAKEEEVWTGRGDDLTGVIGAVWPYTRDDEEPIVPLPVDGGVGTEDEAEVEVPVEEGTAVAACPPRYEAVVSTLSPRSVAKLWYIFFATGRAREEADGGLGYGPPAALGA